MCNYGKLVARYLHVFKPMSDKLLKPGQLGDVVMMYLLPFLQTGRFGDVMMTYLTPFLPLFVEMVADTSSLHHQIDQASPIFLTFIENTGRPGYIQG